ncbi:hypothetical protein Cyast_1347 [Cyanobacterium stanieri PCC 7202]|uniref:Uncharacterized protein n=1 Tax=Cyanobacterium stanieri (strain ATCC 29140 / PCC 7202) TaxID=292563 RepID=K9YLF7_CYASC|nr:hypothetical protein Cyast_1347 [Cyanobacterium stanieri PCC 7202]
MYQKIYCVNHIGKNLLIVGYLEHKQWQFQVVTSTGEMVKQVNQFSTPQQAENEGKKWIDDNLK